MMGRQPTSLIVMLLAIACVTPHGAAPWAQEKPTEASAPATTPVPTAIPAAEIPERAELAASQFRGFTQDAAPSDEIERLEDKLDAKRQKLQRLSEETSRLVGQNLTRTELEEMERRWLREEVPLDGWLATLRARATALDANLANIRKETDLWLLTERTAEELGLPPALRDTVRSTLTAAADAEKVTGDRRDHVLTLQTRVSDLKSLVADALIPLRQGIGSQRRGLLTPEQPPIWRTDDRPSGSQSLPATVRGAVQSAAQSIVTYVQENTAQLAWHGILYVALLVVLVVLHHRADRLAPQEESIAPTARLLGRPVAAATLLAALVEDWFHPMAPLAWSSVLSVVLLLALLRILPRLIPRNLKPALIVLVVMVLLRHLSGVLPDTVLLYRALLALESALTLGSLLWVAHQLDPRDGTEVTGWNLAVIRVCRIGAALMTIALFGNIIGAVNLAELLTRGTLISVFAALLLWAGAVIVRGAEAVAMRTQTAQKLNMVRSYPNRIRAVTGKLIRFVAITIWLGSTLSAFGLYRPAVTAASALLETKISVGQFSISPFTIIPVLIAIWLTFKASTLIRFLLETDVYSRVTLPRGVPGTISKITNYVILTIGFFIVAAMLGVDLTKLTIVVGALGVGIGFGLQNIVNNFVSGLILLFERPIKEGDKIDVDALSGVVQKIGMRASIVKTWQGAEVIVPNADLISGKLINWTLSDTLRRIEIPIGVAYGTDPNSVIEVLLDVANQHPEILDDPAPGVPFMNFGDSSLDFQLRCWTCEDFIRVGSELRVEITRALKEQGIQIPFPQRDVHLYPTGSTRPGDEGQ